MYNLYAPEYNWNHAFAKRFQDNNNMSLNENKNKRSHSTLIKQNTV